MPKYKLTLGECFFYNDIYIVVRALLKKSMNQRCILTQEELHRSTALMGESVFLINNNIFDNMGKMLLQYVQYLSTQH